MDPTDREKTAFVPPFFLHQFQVMAFGLCDAPSNEHYSHNTEEHFKHLQEVLERLCIAGLKLKPSKCKGGGIGAAGAAMAAPLFSLNMGHAL